MEFAVIDWMVDPVAFHLGARGVRWYGILLATGFLIAYLVYSRMGRKEGLKQDTMDKLAVFIIIGVVLGLRLGHCFFYNPAYYWQNPVDILKIWEGGLASHGGALGILIAVWLFARKQERPFLYWLDRLAVIVPIPGALVRLGNLINHEIVGVPTNLPWAFKFYRLSETPLPRHPTQLYEAIFYFLFFFFIFFLYRKKKWGNRHGLLLGVFFTAMFIFRFLIEYTKTYQVEFAGYDLHLRMGQILSIPFIIIGIWLIIRAFKKKESAYL